MLRNVQIENFRSCRNTAVLLSGPLAALVGRNGVGKTNILQSLVLLRDLTTNADHVDANFGSGPRPFQITASIDLAGQLYVYEFKRGLKLTAGNPKAYVVESLKSNPRDQNEPSRIIYERGDDIVRSPLRNGNISVRLNSSALPVIASLLPEGDPLSMAVNPLRQFLGGINYYVLGDDSDGGGDIIPETDYQKWRKQREDGGAAASSIGFKLLQLHNEKHELFEELRLLVGSNGLGLVDILFHVLETSYTPAEGDTPAAVSASNSKIHIVLFKPLEGMGGHGESRRFSELSAGTRRVIRLVVSLLFDASGVMLIEEPEASIHPGLLRKLIDVLRSYSSKTQILFSTHSSEVIDMLRPEEILLVDAPNGSTRVRALDSHEVQRASQFLRSEGALSEYFETIESL